MIEFLGQVTIVTFLLLAILVMTGVGVMVVKSLWDDFT